MLPWQIAIILRVILANAVVPILIKKQADRIDMHRRFLLSFVIGGVISTILYLSFSTTFELALLLMSAGLGGLTVFGTFFSWKAMAISGSKTSVLAFSDDVIAMLLSAFFLNEWNKVTPLALLGIGLCFLAIIGFVMRARVRERFGDVAATPTKFFLYVFLYSTIWGMSYFLQKLFAVHSLGIWNLLGGWYIGGTLVAWCIFRCTKKTVAQSVPQRKLTQRDIMMVSFLSVGLVGSMGLQYIIYHGTIQLAAQPIFLVGEMVLQALVFLWFFPAERKHFDRYEIASAVLALIGTLLIMGFQI